MNKKYVSSSMTRFSLAILQGRENSKDEYLLWSEPLFGDAETIFRYAIMKLNHLICHVMLLFPIIS